MSLEVIVKDDQLVLLLESMFDSTEDTGDLLEGIGQDIQAHIDLEFADSVDPYGKKWAALKAPRKKRKGKKQVGKSDKPLVDTAILSASFTTEGAEGSLFEIGEDFVRVGSEIEYAQTHDKGDEDRGITQRQIVPDPKNMPDDLMEVIFERIQNHFSFN